MGFFFFGSSKKKRRTSSHSLFDDSPSTEPFQFELTYSLHTVSVYSITPKKQKKKHNVQKKASRKPELPMNAFVSSLVFLNQEVHEKIPKLYPRGLELTKQKELSVPQRASTASLNAAFCFNLSTLVRANVARFKREVHPSLQQNCNRPCAFGTTTPRSVQNKKVGRIYFLIIL